MFCLDADERQRTVLKSKTDSAQSVLDVLQRSSRSVLDLSLNELAVLVVSDGAREKDEVARNDEGRADDRD